MPAKFTLKEILIISRGHWRRFSPENRKPYLGLQFAFSVWLSRFACLDLRSSLERMGWADTICVVRFALCVLRILTFFVCSAVRTDF